MKNDIITELQNSNISDAKTFSQLLNGTITLIGIKEVELANYLSIGVETVNYPHLMFSFKRA